MQQSGFNDMQLLQQNLIYKQIQELQRQQQLQHLGDNNRLQNSFNQVAKQNPGAQFSPLINGVPVSDEQNMLRSRLQIMESTPSRASFDRSMLLQEQTSALRSMNSSPQQFDASLCGAPISESRGGMNHLWNVQGSPDMFPKSESKGLMMNNLYPDELGMSDEAFASKQGTNDYQMRGQGPFFPRNFPEDNSLQGSDSLPEFSGRQAEMGWQENKNSGEMVPLDPLEAKILYNTDCSIWEAFGDPSNLASESFGNTFGQTIQSGSWSALMQSAVAETSSIETTQQERWSCLNNADTLNGCQTSNMNNLKQKSEWEVCNNLKPMSATNEMNSFFPGFHSRDDENQKAHGNSWATQAFQNDMANKKNSSAFMKFEKGLQENFQNSSETGNDSFRKRKEISQAMNDQEPSLFDKSSAPLTTDMRVSRDCFSSPRSNIGNQNRSLIPETYVDDPSTSSVSRFPNYVNLSPSLPYFKSSQSGTTNTERATSKEQWNDGGSSSQWKPVPSSIDNVPHFNSHDSFPILEASTVHHARPVQPNENSISPLSLWRNKAQQFKGKSESPIVQKDEKQEPDSFTFPRFGNASNSNAKCDNVNEDHSAPTLPWMAKNGHVAIPEEASVKKRKVEPRLPWRVQITQELTSVPSLSVAEDNWSRAANRSLQKETALNDDVLAHQRSKRRLALVSQLTQILFPPLPDPFFSTDFFSAGCDPLTYVTARASLGDSCGLLSSKENNNSTDADESTRQKKNRLEESLGCLLSRLKRLETEFQRVEKTATVAELRTEVQELEKFAVINRFAKFHGRGPAEVGLGRLNLQRYVNAFPLPPSLPDGVHCLPL